MQKQGFLYFDIWRADLRVVLEKFQAWRSNTGHYFLKVFIFFVFLKINKNETPPSYNNHHRAFGGVLLN